MITETYKTEAECARKFFNDKFDCFPALDLSNMLSGWYEKWNFEGIMDDEDAYEDESDVDTYGITHYPMWGTWFIPRGFMADWILDHKEDVARCGITLIFDDDGSLFAIGIDGAGYSFFDEHWVPLYRAFGCKWHDEEPEEN